MLNRSTQNNYEKDTNTQSEQVGRVERTFSFNAVCWSKILALFYFRSPGEALCATHGRDHEIGN